jgi:hypothetical protein
MTSTFNRKQFQSLVREKNSNPYIFQENKNKVKIYVKNSELLDSQILFNNRNTYLSLIKNYLSGKIDFCEYRQEFLKTYKKDDQIYEDLEKDFQKLAGFPIHPNSAGFSSLISDVFDDCIEINSDGAGDEVLIEILAEMEEYSKIAESMEMVSFVETSNDLPVLRSTMFFFILTTSVVYSFLQPEIFHYLLNLL